MQPNFADFFFSLSLFIFSPLFLARSLMAAVASLLQSVPQLCYDLCCPKDPSPGITLLIASLCPCCSVPAFGCSPASSWPGTLCPAAPAAVRLAQPLARWAVLTQSSAWELVSCRCAELPGWSWKEHPAVLCSIQHCNA